MTDADGTVTGMKVQAKHYGKIKTICCDIVLSILDFIQVWTLRKFDHVKCLV